MTTGCTSLLARPARPPTRRRRPPCTSGRPTSCARAARWRWLDELAAWVAGWHRTDRPRVERPVGLIFAADHGVAAAEAVSAYPTDVTAAMFAAYRQGRSTISAFARHAGATVDAIDVGIGRPTGDIRFEAALSAGALRRDRRRSPSRPSTGSTATCSCSARWASATRRRRRRSPAALAGGETAAWVGRGTGVDDAGLARKRVAVQQAVRPGRLGRQPRPLLSDLRRRLCTRGGRDHRSRPNGRAEVHGPRRLGILAGSQGARRQPHRAGQRRPVHSGRLPGDDRPDRGGRRHRGPRRDRQPLDLRAVPALARARRCPSRPRCTSSGR